MQVSFLALKKEWSSVINVYEGKVLVHVVVESSTLHIHTNEYLTRHTYVYIYIYIHTCVYTYTQTYITTLNPKP